MSEQDPSMAPGESGGGPGGGGGGGAQDKADDLLRAVREATAAAGNPAPAPAASKGDDPLAAALRAAKEAVAAVQSTPGVPSPEQARSPQPSALDLPGFQGTRPGSGLESKGPVEPIDLLADVNLNVKIELGRTRMLVEDVLRLGEGSVVELDKLAGDPVDVYVNDRHVARGEVLVLNDNFCVRIHEIIKDPGNERG